MNQSDNLSALKITVVERPYSISFLCGVDGPGFELMLPESNRINLKYDPYLLK